MRKLNTPRRVALTASGIVPCAVRITTGIAGRLAMDGVDQRKAVDALHAQVGDDELRPVHLQAGERRLARFDGRHGVARGAQAHRDQLQQALVVVDEQDVRVAGSVHA